MAKWINTFIGDLCTSVSISFNSKLSKVILINTSDVLDGNILNHTLVENKNLKGQFKKTFKKGDILYSEIRPANKRFAYVDIEDTSLYIASTKLMVLRPNKNIIEPRFLFSILKSQSIVNELQHLAETRSGTFPQITFISELAPMEVKIPDRITQKQIISILETIESLIQTNITINDNLSA
ncbi:restriction endonuclease subunit S [Treponema sp. OMZ 791]|uniref:restriction endonuclease subunit S n=1 Tax=Treponema sp. OMZ 791 TaxID=2563666 RepID=UPI0020A42F7A|nr:restriction endonuclease subunit S [Treponema sp. OMZ 791]UTC72670.1 restriction endonuclease subunit S [Treponema sp. OMZ 791]